MIRVLLSYFTVKRLIANAVTCFFPSYIQGAVLPVTVFFILLVW